MSTDKQLTCVDCGAAFTFSAGEQDKFAQLGFTNEPKRCAPCRAAKKASKPGGAPRNDRPRPSDGGAPREMFSAVCAQCGTNTEVPFKPRGDRPVYCRECFSAQKK
jgi:CxxC-x17-CxxC domain-containing protein